MRLVPDFRCASFAGSLTAFLLVLLVALSPACSSGLLEKPVHKMGELTTVGPVVYNVLETEWRDHLGDSIRQKFPKNRFLVLRLTVTNSGNRDIAIPLLSLTNENGDSFREITDVKGLPNWLGLLRVLSPAAHMQGVIVFDVPTSDYLLRVTDCGDLENEKTALIEIPLTFEGKKTVEPPGQDSF